MQAQAFLWTAAAGMVLGLFFDFYRLWRGWRQPGRFLTNLGDALFWLVSAVVGAVMILAANGGDLRLYVVIGFLAGAGLYFTAFSQPLLRLLAAVGAGISRLKDAVLLGLDAMLRTVSSDLRRRSRPLSHRLGVARGKVGRWSRARLAASGRPARQVVRRVGKALGGVGWEGITRIFYRKKKEL